MDLKNELIRFIENPHFVCIGAKAAVKKNALFTLVAQDLSQPNDDVEILVHLYQFIEQWKKRKNTLQTMAVIFENPLGSNEFEFETSLWRRLQHLHDLDRELFSWDPQVSADINSANFSFSIGGYGFFIVGLHPHSSRKSRQFIRPTLIFNLHEQFQRMKESKTFELMRNKIRERELKYHGSINPMVKDFGELSEAVQYSGRSLKEPIFHYPFQSQEQNNSWTNILPQTGTSFLLEKDDLLIVKKLQGNVSSSLYCFSAEEPKQLLSSAKSIQYNQKIYLSYGDALYSNKSKIMLSIIYDEVKKHDFLLGACNQDSFRILKDEQHLGCQDYLQQAFSAYGLEQHELGTTFNLFLNSSLTPRGKIKINPSMAQKEAKIIFKSHMNLIVGLTSCSPLPSDLNQIIHYKILKNKKNERNELGC